VYGGTLPALRDGTLDQPRKHFTKVSSLPLLGLEYLHEYLDRYSAKEQMRRGLPELSRDQLLG
jgi:hypothetical protein